MRRYEYREKLNLHDHLYSHRVVCLQFHIADASKYWGRNGPDSDEFVFRTKEQMIIIQNIMETRPGLTEGTGGAGLQIDLLIDEGFY